MPMFEDAYRLVIKRNLRRTVQLALLLTLISLGSVAASALLMKIIDDVVPSCSGALLLRTVLLYVAISVLQSIVSYCCGMANTRLLLESSNALKFDLLHCIFRRDGAYFAANSRGEIYNSIENDSSKFCAFVISNFSTVFMTITSLLISLVYLGILEWKLLVLILLLQPTVLIFQAVMRPRIIRISEKSRAFSAEYDTLSQEIVSDPAELILSGQAQKMMRNYKNKTAHLIKLGIESSAIELFSANTGEFLNAITLCCVIGYSGWSIIKGTMSIGELIVFINYSQKIVDNIGKLLDFSIDVSGITPVYRKISTLIHAELPEKQQNPAISETPVLEAAHLDFSYDDGKTMIFSDFSYRFRFGGSYGIIGKTGAGKSTVARLIYGLWAPQNGSLTVDGIPCCEIAYPDMDKTVTYVSSSPLILNDTLRSNLTMFDPEITDEQIWTALRKMQLAEFFRQTEHQLDTRIGESGLRLSAGQRQRIALARSLLSGRKIIILDEPTAALDAETAQHVSDVLYDSFSDRTLIIITHNQDILHRCDAVLRIENGTVSETKIYEKIKGVAS
ncbi:MAG: ABC transporter ATP-binding protein [Oscillospiraceae bacterium]|nr:ABC transporter ATP-binding protein [Oscillospiraceae bacterium]